MKIARKHDLMKITVSKAAQWILSLFVFVVMIDPADSLLKLKIPVFLVLLILLLLSYGTTVSVRNLYIIGVCYSIFMVTNVIGFFMDYPTDYEFTIFFYKGFVMLLLLFWIKQIRLIERTYFPSVVIALIVSSIFALSLVSSEIELMIYMWVNSRIENTIMIGNRSYIGFDLFTVYYSTAPLVFMPLSIWFYRFLNQEAKRNQSFIMSVLLIIPIVIGGTRALLLFGLMIIGLLIFQKLWSKGRISKLFTIGGFIVSFMVSIVVVIALLNDSTEASNEVKLGSLSEIVQHFYSNPETLLFGNGVGSMYESVIRSHTVNYEVSVVDFIRWFGIPLTLVLLTLYSYPLYLLYKKRNILIYAIPLMVSYSFYLFLGCTNPYLYSSSGMLALLIVYNYALNPSYENYR